MNSRVSSEQDCPENKRQPYQEGIAPLAVGCCRQVENLRSQVEANSQEGREPEQ
jgi:hypothetical protein